MNSKSIYHQLKLSNADEMASKASIMVDIERVISKANISNHETAGLLDIDFNEFNKIRRGLFRKYEYSYLTKLLRTLETSISK